MLGELSYEVLHCAVSSSVSLQKFYKGWRRALSTASPRSGERERKKKKKGRQSPCEEKQPPLSWRRNFPVDCAITSLGHPT